MFQNSTNIPQHLYQQSHLRKVQRVLSQCENERRKMIDNYSYAIDQEIGKGFSSTVYKGRNERTLENVAVKVIDMKRLKQSIYTQLLKNEINALKQFNHQNILKLFDVCYTQNNTYIITEFCDSGDLDKYLRKNFKIKEPEAIRILQAIVNALNEINLKGFIHRDIKPANILLKGNEPKLADFGFALPIWQAKIQQRKINVGTPLYMSPQALRQQDYSEKGDVWAVGIVYFEMLFGRTPYNAQSESALLFNILNKQLVIPQTPSVSELSKDFIQQCLQIDDNKRFNVKDMFEHRIIQSNYFQIYLQENSSSETKLTFNNSSLYNNKRNFNQNLKRYTNKDLSIHQNDVNKQNDQNQFQIKVTQRSSSQNQMYLPQYKIDEPLIEETGNTKNTLIQQTIQLGDKTKSNNQILLFYINYCRYLFKFSQYLTNSKFIAIDIRDRILFMLAKCIAIKIDQLSKILDKENNFDNQFKLLGFEKYKQSESFNGFCQAITEYQIKYMKHFQMFLKLALKNNFQIDPIIGSSCNSCLIENNTVYEITLYYLNQGLNQLQLHLNQIKADILSEKLDCPEFQSLLFIDEGFQNCKDLIQMIQNCQHNYYEFQKRLQFNNQKVGSINFNYSEYINEYFF